MSILTCIGLMFYYASELAVAEFTVNDVMTVISLLLFSMGYAAQVLSWSTFSMPFFTRRQD